MEEALKYFAIDWFAMICTFLAIWQIGNKNRIGFVIMMFGNSAWISVGLLANSHAMVLANTVFFLMNARALLKWSRNEVA
jgi:hypothetical protein